MEDKRLERLYDYTKFHIGIYLSVAAGLLALVGLAAKSEEGQFLAKLIGSPLALVGSALAMFAAGVAGAVVASSSTECETYGQL
ncbi:MAG: hypothetical protein E8D49_10545 [Nitrospira sp.]|nr:MAG: hypothetical protein E8D49_10545 [Nitrospira sp.]